ncbi:GNAT family N-acetyltransferase [Mesonia sp. K7]|uniref:GNAT family N-acetyltransferase n=1 Tax=Mesonia sp. K7 TaxID=2218606 RepID=UPI000DA6FE69|nr:GNAT family N-acetyltransferase [Mesonia sp. K7]PZD79345.1 hypothetical protein DNG35_02340 [Mesonia sp. K7]
MQIILYTSEDLPKCLEIFDSNCPSYFNEHERFEFENFLKENKFPYWLVTEGDKIVGCGGIYISDTDFERAEFDKEVGFAWGMIHQDEHKKGYGKALSKFRIQFLKENFPDYQKVLRTTQNTNKFFEKFGFTTYKFVENGFGGGFDKYVMVYQKES